MSKRRRKHSAEFKTQVVLDMLKNVETLSELSSKYGVHPNQMTKWKRTFLERASGIFSDRSSRLEKKTEQLESELYKKIGQLQVELDWLKKKSGILI